MSNSDFFDVVVVGASLAGATAALCLAREGLKVALLEKNRFPRRTPCGEGLSVFTAKALLGLLDKQLDDLPHQKLGYYRVVGPRVVDFKGKDGEPQVIGVSRESLDDLLLSKIREHKNITLMEGEAAEEVLQSQEAATVRTAKGYRVQSRQVILATGKNRKLLSRLGFTFRRARWERYGMSAHFRLDRELKDPGVVIKVKPGFEVYTTPVQPKLINLAFLGSKAAIGALSCPTELDRAVALAFDELGHRGEQVEKFVGAGPFGFRAKSHQKGRVLLVGDALETLDPIGGMGMTQAVLTALYASHAILDGLENEKSPDLAGRIASRASRSDRLHLRRMTFGARFAVGCWGRSSLVAYLVPATLLQFVERRLHHRLSESFSRLVPNPLSSEI